MRPSVSWVPWLIGAGVGVYVALATADLGDHDKLFSVTLLERTMVGGKNRTEFEIELPRATQRVESSCKCLRLGTVAEGRVRGVVECDEVPSYVTPGVLVFVGDGVPTFVEVSCCEH